MTPALIAADKHYPKLTAIVKAARATDATIYAPAGCVAEAWRDGAVQTRLALLLKGIHEFPPLDLEGAKAAGELLARSGTSQIVDAHLVTVAIRVSPSVVVTSDSRDITALLATGTHDVAVTAL